MESSFGCYSIRVKPYFSLFNWDDPNDLNQLNQAFRSLPYESRIQETGDRMERRSLRLSALASDLQPPTAQPMPIQPIQPIKPIEPIKPGISPSDVRGQLKSYA